MIGPVSHTPLPPQRPNIPTPTTPAVDKQKGISLHSLKEVAPAIPTLAGATESDRALASQLLVTHHDVLDQTAIQHLIEIKNSEDPSIQSTILSLSTTDISSRYQIIALIGLLYNPAVTDINLIQNLIRKLLSLSTQTDDVALLSSGLKGISTKLPLISDEFKQQIIQQLREPKLQTTLPADLHKDIAEFIAKITTPEQATKAPIVTPLTPQQMSEAARSKLAALFMQIRVMTTITAEAKAPEWLMMFMAFMGIDAALASIDTESNPSIPDGIGFIVLKDAQLPDQWARSQAIQIIEEITADELTRVYKKLLTLHIKRIYVFLPHLAFHPKIDRELLDVVLPPSVRLIKTHVFGPGLGDLIAYIAHRIFVSGINKTANGLIEESISKFRYWVMPQFSVINKQNWFKIMRRKKPIRGHLHPILSLVDTPTCINSLGSTEECVSYMGALVHQALSSEHAYQKATITYKNYYQGALDLLDQIQSVNPNLEVEILHADPETCAFWGNHIGLTLI